jgi:transposase, IS30 family
VAGPWEGDLIVGRGNKSYVGTPVQHTTRCVLLLHLPAGGGATQLLEALTAQMANLHPHRACAAR